MPWVENLTNLVVKKHVANTRGHGGHKYFFTNFIINF